MYKYVIDNSNQSYDVYADLISSAAGQYASRRPHIIALIRELLATRQLHGDHLGIEQDMGRDIGTTDVVTTADTDTIYYAQAAKSHVYSRFAKNRLPQASTLLTVIIDRDPEGNYQVHDAWIGAHHPAFPGDAAESPDSVAFWRTHALVQDAVAIQTKSITKTSPY